MTNKKLSNEVGKLILRFPHLGDRILGLTNENGEATSELQAIVAGLNEELEKAKKTLKDALDATNAVLDTVENKLIELEDDKRPRY